jgi:hypothetical protein
MDFSDYMHIFRISAAASRRTTHYPNLLTGPLKMKKVLFGITISILKFQLAKPPILNPIIGTPVNVSLSKSLPWEMVKQFLTI